MRRAAVGLGFLLWMLVVPGLWAQSEPEAALRILSLNTTSFPDVSMSLRVQDENGQALPGLQAADFTLSEAHSGLETAADQDTLNLVFVIDLSDITAGERAQVQSILRDFASEVYSTGDTITFITMRNTAFNIIPANNQSQILSTANDLNFSGGTRIATYQDALQAAVSQLEPARARGSNTQIILIGAYLPGSGIGVDLHGIPLHVLHVHAGTRGSFAPAFAALATGRFFTQSGADKEELAALWDLLENNRLLYTLSYRASGGQSGLRQVEVSTPVGRLTISDVVEYSMALRPPSVLLSGIEARNTITRSGTVITTGNGGDVYSFDPDTEIIGARVSFEDGIIRRLEQARLLVDGVLLPASVLQMPAAGGFELVWDLSLYTETSSVSLVVEVVDELGLTGESTPALYDIAVVLPAPAVTDPCLAPDGSRLGTPECLQLGPEVLLVGGAVALVLVLGLLLARRRRRAPQPAPAMTPGMRVSKVAQPGTELAISGLYSQTEVEPRGGTDVEGAEAGVLPHDPNAPVYAEFKVLKGPLAGRIIRMTKPEWVFGRELGAGVDFEFNESNVSARHCTIALDRETQRYTIEDHNSSNGTWVNGYRLAPNRRHSLKPDAEIQLAKNNPIRLRFMPLRVGRPGRPATRPRRETGYTYIDPNPTDLDDTGGGHESVDYYTTDLKPPAADETGLVDRSGVFSGLAEPPPARPPVSRGSEPKPREEEPRRARGPRSDPYKSDLFRDVTDDEEDPDRK